MSQHALVTYPPEVAHSVVSDETVSSNSSGQDEKAERKRIQSEAWRAWFRDIGVLALFLSIVLMQRSIYVDYDSESVLRTYVNSIESPDPESNQVGTVDNMGEAWNWIRALIADLYSETPDRMKMINSLNQPYAGVQLYQARQPMLERCIPKDDQDVDAFNQPCFRNLGNDFLGDVMLTDVNVIVPETCGLQYLQGIQNYYQQVGLLNRTVFGAYLNQTLPEYYNLDVNPTRLQTCNAEFRDTSVWIPYSVTNGTGYPNGLPAPGETKSSDQFDGSTEILVPQKITNDILDTLEQYQWVNVNTTSLGVQIYISNRQSNRVGVVSVVFELTPSGAMSSTLRVATARGSGAQNGRLSDNRPYSTSLDKFRMALEIIFLVVLAHSLKSTFKVWKAMKRERRKKRRTAKERKRKNSRASSITDSEEEALSVPAHKSRRSNQLAILVNFVFVLNVILWGIVVGSINAAESDFEDAWRRSLVKQMSQEACTEANIYETFFSFNQTTVNGTRYLTGIPNWCRDHPNVTPEICCRIALNVKLADSDDPFTVQIFLAIFIVNVFANFRPILIVFNSLAVLLISIRIFFMIPRHSRLALLPLIFQLVRACMLRSDVIICEAIWTALFTNAHRSDHHDAQFALRCFVTSAPHGHARLCFCRSSTILQTWRVRKAVVSISTTVCPQSLKEQL